jgi:hypothetical protein
MGLFMAIPAKAALLLAFACACGGGGGDDQLDAGPDAGPNPTALQLPAVIDFPYVTAGGGPSMVDVTLGNPGDEDVDIAGWSFGGDSGFRIVSAPTRVAAGEQETVVLEWIGSDVVTIASGSFRVDSEPAPPSAELWAVAGDPALPEADFAPVTGPGGVAIGDSAVLSMPTAPFPDPSGVWTDDRVHLFIPEGYQDTGEHDLVLHFHGHSTTIDATVPGHRYREQVHASGANVILIVPQGPVNAASGNFGKLMDPAGTAALLDEVLIALYRAGRITRPGLGQLTLTSHSGGYAAVAANLDLARQANLFDSLYGFVSTYLDFALGGGLLRSNYTSAGGTDANNLSLFGQLDDAGAAPVDAPTQRALAAPEPIIYFTAASHGGATRDDCAYGEQLRWTARRGRGGPRAELRAVTSSTVSWLAPADEGATGWSIQSSTDGVAWVTVGMTTAQQFALPAGTAARVRVMSAGGQATDVFRVDPDADVLIVDGFDRVVDGSFGGLDHDFAAVVGEAAGAVHTVSNEAITEDGFDLSPYRVVIWLVGDESTDDHTFTAAERAAIDAYLDGGGQVILSGSEIGYELGATGAGAAWLADVAGAVQASDDANSLTVDGMGFGGPDAPYAEEFPDSFTTTGAGTVVLQYGTGAAAAVGIAGRGVLVGFPLELMDDPADLSAVLAALIDFVAP